jgi:sporulation protein YlmC with PRC-barrel domain
MTDGARLYLGLHLLDRQIIDVDGRPAGKVDDLELSDNDAPVVTAILCGPAAYGPRFGGRLGTWIVAIHRRLVREERVRIPWAYVARIHSAVHLATTRRDAGATALDDWVRTHFIGRLPGADDARE